MPEPRPPRRAGFAELTAALTPLAGDSDRPPGSAPARHTSIPPNRPAALSKAAAKCRAIQAMSKIQRLADVRICR